MDEVIDGVLVSTGNCGSRKRHRAGGKRTFISEFKRIALEKSRGIVKVKGFKNYRFEDASEQYGAKLLKKGINAAVVKSVVLQSLPLSHEISVEKKKDVDKVLKLMYGEEWQNQPDFNWYKGIIYNALSAGDEEAEK